MIFFSPAILLLMNIDSIVWQAKIELKVYGIKSYKTRSNSDFQWGRGFFLCPRGQRVGSAPNVHESPR